MARSVLGAGKKTTRSGPVGIGKSSLEPLEKIAQPYTSPKQAKKGNAAAYRIPEGIEDVVSLPGYVQIQKGSRRYLVKQSVADGYSKQTKLTRMT